MMNIAEDKEKGLFVVKLDDYNLLQFARCKFDGKLMCFVPDSVIYMQNYITGTKKEMINLAKKLKFPINHIDKIGNRFGVSYGLRHDFRDGYFLARWD